MPRPAPARRRRTRPWRPPATATTSAASSGYVPIETLTSRFQTGAPRTASRRRHRARRARRVWRPRRDRTRAPRPPRCRRRAPHARSSHAMPGGSAPFAHEPVIRGSPRRLGVEVRTEASRHEPEPVDERIGPPEQVGVGGRGLEPTVGAGAASGEHDAGVPGFPEDLVEAVRPPDRPACSGCCRLRRAPRPG